MKVTHICFDRLMLHSHEHFIRWRTNDKVTHHGNGICIILGITEVNNFKEAAQVLLKHHINSTPLTRFNWINIKTSKVTKWDCSHDWDKIPEET